MDWNPLHLLFQNPADQAMSHLNQIPDTLKPYFESYINSGNRATGESSSALSEMLRDPNAIISRLGAGYKQSPGYQFKLNQGLGAINNAAAAGGMVGTQQNQQQAGELATNLASQDYNDYLKNVLGVYNTGLEGSLGMSRQGYGASSDLATSLANLLSSKSNLAYSGAANQNEMTGNLLNAIIQAMASGAKGAATGGAA